MSNAADNTVPLDPKKFDAPVEVGKPGSDVALVTARRAQAVALRLAGLTYEQIANEVGYSDRSVARVAVVQALQQVQAQGVEQLREIESMRLDRLQAAVWQQALRGDLAAVRTVLRISERRSKLLGLDAPLQIELTEGVDEQIGALRAQLADDAGLYVVTDLDREEPPDAEAPEHHDQ